MQNRQMSPAEESKHKSGVFANTLGVWDSDLLFNGRDMHQHQTRQTMTRVIYFPLLSLCVCYAKHLCLLTEG